MAVAVYGARQYSMPPEPTTLISKANINDGIINFWCNSTPVDHPLLYAYW